MTKRNSTFKLLAVVAAMAALQGCGGGGHGGADAAGAITPPASNDAVATEVQAQTQAPTGDDGAVTARFAANENARYMLLAASSQSFGNKLTDSAQADSGAMTRLGANALSGASQTVNIAGDANFALGRWVSGTVTRSSGADTLTGDDAQSYHYVAFNGVAALPASGDVNCAGGVFTEPTYAAGSTTADKKGSASGAASVTFGADGGSVQGSINVTVGGETVSVKLPAAITQASATQFAGSMLGGGAGTALTLADAGNGTYALVVAYTAQLQSGARYTGLARLACSSV